ncbi:MAG: UMP kinase [Patescibacteria group bacterium]
MEDSKHIVISLGGSLIVPEEIDSGFLKEFIHALSEYASRGFRFVIITGGGRISRNYTLSAQDIGEPTSIDLDWIGIAVTRLNAEFIRVLFGNLAHPDIIFNPEEMPETDKAIMVGGGWKPGNSSDLAAVIVAKSIGARTIINLSNIDYVYDKDPRYNPDAIKIESASWGDLRALLPKEWEPGLNSPFDPIAAEKAEALGLEVAIMNGKNIDNLRNYIDQKPFIGTIIR